MPPIEVIIIGAPTACADGGVQEPWRGVARWTAGQLRQRFGAEIEVKYVDLFDPACPPLPAGAQLPLVLINGTVISSGGKISVPAISRHIETLTLRSAEPPENP